MEWREDFFPNCWIFQKLPEMEVFFGRSWRWRRRCSRGGPRRGRPRRPWGWVAVAGGVGFGWYWIHYQLPGFVSEVVSDLLLRPVEVGPVQSVGLTELKLGKSEVLPRPEDPDSAEAQQVAPEPAPFDPNAPTPTDVFKTPGQPLETMARVMFDSGLSVLRKKEGSVAES